MDYSLIIAVTVLLGAIGGFVVLARALLEIWRPGARGKTATGPADGASAITPGARPATEPNSWGEARWCVKGMPEDDETKADRVSRIRL
jgi:hypothetical protein